MKRKSRIVLKKRILKTVWLSSNQIKFIRLVASSRETSIENKKKKKKKIYIIIQYCQLLNTKKKYKI